ncbi:FecR family protein [Pseudomonas pisciculturae]|uniref:FecR family protein n=1 Tax=Pseudomonas pisciculturae TaxID=2730413 RepID=UPI00190F6B27|nr:FecR domain-containing protein [Pseudomonas pisciculturae]
MKSARGNKPDPLQPFADALRERVPSKEALLAEGKAFTKSRRSKQKSLSAGLLIVALAGGLWQLDPAWRTEDVQVAIGQRQDIRLADGTAVTLNSGTHLRIEHRLRSRQLELVRGETSFTVVHEDSPFIVRSQGVRVRDIGTVFNLRSDARGVDVGVIEGSVEVRSGRAAPQVLSVGQQVRATAEQIGSVQPANREALTAWQHGKLRFDGTPLSEVVRTLQQYRAAPIRVADAATGELRLSGEFDTERVEALVGMLPRILPVSLVRTADGSVILNRLR